MMTVGCFAVVRASGVVVRGGSRGGGGCPDTSPFIEVPFLKRTVSINITGNA